MIQLDDYGKKVFRQFVQYRTIADVYNWFYRRDSYRVHWLWYDMITKTVEEWHR
jgi:hypothetical protein